MTFDIRTMTHDDLPLAMRLKAQAGWNQTEADLKRFLALSPAGCFVGQLDGRPVGTAATFVFGAVGWIAMMLVDEAARGRGVGTSLMRHCLAQLDAAGVASIRLDATEQGLPLYEKLGFARQLTLARYAGVPVGQEFEGRAELARRPDWDELMELDRAVTRTPRRPLLLRLFEENPDGLHVTRHRGRITGFLTWRPGSAATFVGPCVATSQAAGSLLLADACRRLRGRRVCLDVPVNHPAAAVAKDQGLTIQRTLVRMVRGPAVDEKLDSLWASSGPEKG